jgi:SAM-dependent methyltransferase
VAGRVKDRLPKPAHLGPRYGAQFGDASVARAYHTRPPYPAQLFEILEGLMAQGDRVVLDLGCGTGDVALGLAGRADRVDAVDPSRAMLEVARGRPGAQAPGLRWIESTAEGFRPDVRYALAIAAESFHWMEWTEVCAWLPGSLQAGAVLCLVSGREMGPVPWEGDLGALIPKYSTNREYRPYDLVRELVRRDLFRETGRRSTRPVAWRQRLDDYVESFHTRNGLSRQRMTEEAAAAFDDALRRLAEPRCPGGWVEGEVRATVVWGTPLRPTRSVGRRA